MERKKESRAARRKRVIRNRIIAIGVLVILIIVVIVIIASCSKKNSPATAQTAAQVAENAEGKDQADEDSETATEETTTAAPSVKNEKPVRLYTMDYTTMTIKKADTIRKVWTPAEDLESFGAFVSEEDSFAFTNETQAHDDTWNSVKTDTDYKIGYELQFEVNGETKIITIRKPGDIESNPDLYNGDYPEDGDYSSITGYLGVWVYDDLHQETGAFYRHILQSEVTDETLLTSIKLRPTPQSDDIDGLVLKAFSYSSEEEFDADGHYIGNYADEVSIEKQ